MGFAVAYYTKKQHRVANFSSKDIENIGLFREGEMKSRLFTQMAAHAKMVMLMVDSDYPGQEATRRILPLLARKVFVKVIDLPDPSPGDQPDRLKEEDLVNLLGDI